MALQVWLPLNGDLNNQGLSNVTVTNNGATVDNNGKIGKCYSFNGRNNYITMPGIIPTLHFSFGCWYKLNTLGTATVATCRKAAGYGIALFQTNNGCLRFDIGEAGTITQVVLSANTWNHIMVTYDGNVKKVYLNGNLIQSENKVLSSISGLSTKGWCIGASQQSDVLNGGNNYTDGYINDFRIYDHALSAKEVKEISKGLILHYKLDGNDIGITIPRNGGLIPDGVELYDYIQSSGTQYIDTGITPTQDTNCETKAQFITNNAYTSIAQVTTAGNPLTNRFTLMVDGSNNFYFGKGTSIKSYSTTVTSLHTYKIDGLKCYIDGTQVLTLEQQTFTADNTIPLFADKRSGSINQQACLKLYYFKFYNGSTLVRNFLPCTYLGEPGMWDTVENKFYRNQGTGQFTLGNKITLKEYESLTGDDNSYINTGIIPTVQTEIEATFSYGSSGKADRYIFANWDSANATFCINVNSNTLRVFKYSTSDAYQTTLTANTKHTVKVTKNTVIVNGTSTNFTGGTFPSFTKSLLLFGDSPTYLNSATIYEAKRWENGTLMNYFIPVTYNGIPGMWDKVEWKFYANAGAGSFTLGPEVTIQQDVPIFYDSSGYCNHGIITGTLTTDNDSPRYTKSTVFNGSSAINVGHTAKVTDAITISYWAKTSIQAVAVSCTQSGGFSSSSNGNFYIQANGTYGTIPNCGAWNNNAWHHIVNTFDGRYKKIYKDGTLAATQDLGAKYAIQYNASAPIWIGAESQASNIPTTPYFNGSISDVRIYATALSEDDVKELYNTSAFLTNNGALCGYEFNESDSGTDIKKRGIIESTNIYEVNTLAPSNVTITGSGSSQTPSNNGTNVHTTGYNVVFNDISETRKYVIELDFNWSGTWAKGSDGNLNIRFQGSNKATSETSYAWSGTNICCTALNNIKNPLTLITSAPTGGTYHYKTTFTVPKDNAYNGFNLGTRVDYSDGNGSFSYNNLKIYPYNVSLETEKTKIGSNYITCNEIIEI